MSLEAVDKQMRIGYALGRLDTTLRLKPKGRSRLMRDGQSLSGLTEWLDQWLVRKVPVQIPDGGKEFLVRFGPWISLVMLLIGLPVLFAALGIGMLLVPFGGLGYGAGFGVSAVFVLLESGLLLCAVPGLFARRRLGWSLLYYEQLIGLVGSLLAGAVFSGLVGGAIGLYILFQVREKYN